MTVIYAIEDDDADTRIELLIAADSAPRSLTVVSTDRRIRRAAERRRASTILSDDFLDYLDTLRRPVHSRVTSRENDFESNRLEPLSTEEVDAWAREFGEFDDDLVAETPFRSEALDWSDAELERIAQEVEAEFRSLNRPLPPRLRRR